ncbi:hypothetical protein N9L52_08700 [Litoricolaceae bacterium]|nr:hypothetical protein [Litorivicinaceae bacterium]
MWTLLFWTIFFTDVNKPQIEVWGTFANRQQCIDELTKRSPKKALVERVHPDFAVYWKDAVRWIGFKCVENPKQ